MMGGCTPTRSRRAAPLPDCCDGGVVRILALLRRRPWRTPTVPPRGRPPPRSSRRCSPGCAMMVRCVRTGPTEGRAKAFHNPLWSIVFVRPLVSLVCLRLEHRPHTTDRSGVGDLGRQRPAHPSCAGDARPIRCVPAERATTPQPFRTEHIYRNSSAPTLHSDPRRFP